MYLFLGQNRLYGITLPMLTLHLLENRSNNITGLGTTYNVTSGEEWILVKLECYIISHLTFEQIDIELPLSISGP
jgi:hypothetical protein